MRHRTRTAKLGRTSEHRNQMLANLVCSLIKHRRVTTTLAKARAARSVAEKMVTLGKSGTIHDRRLAAARLHQEDVVRILFNDIAPTQKDRPGGYTRIVKLNQRQGDAAPLAILEWVDEVLAERPRRKSTRKKESSAEATEQATSAEETTSAKEGAPQGKEDKPETDKPAGSEKD